MNMPDFLPEIGKLAASFIGSLCSLRWLPGRWWQKLQMLIAGTALSRYSTEPLAKWAGMNEGQAGFFLGLFGMAVVIKIFDTIEKTQVADIFMEWARKTLGLPPKPAKE